MLFVAACATTPHPSSTDGAQVGVAFDRAGEVGAFAAGWPIPRPAARSPPTIRAHRLDQQAGRRDRGDAAGRAGQARPRRRRLALSRLAAAQPGIPRPADQPAAAAVAHQLGLRDDDDQYVDPARRIAPGGAGRPDGLGPEATRPARAISLTPTSISRSSPRSSSRSPASASTMWMRREVLEPMKLDACFNWPTCSDAAVARAVVLTQDGKAVRDDLGGKRPDCPVCREGRRLATSRAGGSATMARCSRPQGGLRISARDLARVGRMLLNGGHARRRAHPVARIGRHAADARVDLRRQQRRHRQGLLLPLRPRDPAARDAGERLPRRSGRRRRSAGRPCRRCLWPALGPVDRPRARAPASPISSPASPTTRRAGAAPSGPPRSAPSATHSDCRGGAIRRRPMRGRFQGRTARLEAMIAGFDRYNAARRRVMNRIAITWPRRCERWLCAGLPDSRASRRCPERRSRARSARESASPPSPSRSASLTPSCRRPHRDWALRQHPPDRRLCAVRPVLALSDRRARHRDLPVARHGRHPARRGRARCACPRRCRAHLAGRDRLPRRRVPSAGLHRQSDLPPGADRLSRAASRSRWSSASCRA